MRAFRFIAGGIATALLAAHFATAADAEGSAGEKTVRAFVDAFNAQNVDAMLAIADDGIEWLSVDGEKIAVETSGRDALRKSMTSYFASCPSCRSSLEWVRDTGTRIVALERASWTTKAGVAKAQRGISVYEFRAGKIARVYYFPAEPEGR